MKLSIGFITSREQHKSDWAIDSLARQLKPSDDIEFIIIDSHAPVTILAESPRRVSDIKIYPPMPNVWSGKHRLPKENWWSKCASLNTFLCLAKHPFIATVDDRSVLTPLWLDAVRRAESEKYVACGAFERRHNIKVENGGIVDFGTLVTSDDREKMATSNPFPCPDWWLFGACVAMPLEWALQVNGYPGILCDSLSSEDTNFGIVLKNNGFPMMYDKSMKIILDRTPELSANPMRRMDKGLGQNDKSHAALARSRKLKQSENPFGSLRELREKIQNGGQFSAATGPLVDWYDQAPVKDFV